MRDERLSSFYLVGETNLALRLGHRTSIDLDLFSEMSFDSADLETYLKTKYRFQTKLLLENTVQGYINDIKVDLLSYPYSLIDEPLTEQGIRMYGLNDIAAMKLVAISDSGTRLKDFVDIAYLSTKMPLIQMLAAYAQKFGRGHLHALRGLSYYDDINFGASIELSDATPFDWKKIAQRIAQMIKHEDRVFASTPI
jgi:hypothetical protein